MFKSKTFTLILIAACTILANIIFFSFRGSLSSGKGPATETTEADLKLERPKVNPRESLADITFYDEITQRPLFNSDRKPEAIIEEEATATVATTGARPELTLTGIVLSDQEQMALVRSKKSPRIKRVKLDEDIDGWKLAKLDSKAAVFRSGTQELILELNRKGDARKARLLNKKQSSKDPRNLREQSGENDIPAEDPPPEGEDFELEMGFGEEGNE